MAQPLELYMKNLESKPPKCAVEFPKIVSEYDQEIPQSQTADNPVAQPRSLQVFFPALNHKRDPKLWPSARVWSRTKTVFIKSLGLMAGLNMFF